MRAILYLIALILVIGWVLGFTMYHAGGIIHILLVLAVISILLGIIRKGEV
ncbi:MAG: lmo0937 family membrane protein [Bacteroidetes bacterium]|nr:lmo0937 family membrane protein [Bacteroidota bacterium]